MILQVFETVEVGVGYFGIPISPKARTYPVQVVSEDADPGEEWGFIGRWKDNY